MMMMMSLFEVAFLVVVRPAPFEGGVRVMEEDEEEGESHMSPNGETLRSASCCAPLQPVAM